MGKTENDRPRHERTGKAEEGRGYAADKVVKPSDFTGGSDGTGSAGGSNAEGQGGQGNQSGTDAGQNEQ